MDKTPKNKKPSSAKSKAETKTNSLESKFSDLAEKLPDISDITKKINLDGILGGIKSMINPEEGASLKIDPKDDLGMKVAELSALLQEMSKAQARLSKDFSKANDLLIELFKDIEAIRSGKKKDE